MIAKGISKKGCPRLYLESYELMPIFESECIRGIYDQRIGESSNYNSMGYLYQPFEHQYDYEKLSLAYRLQTAYECEGMEEDEDVSIEELEEGFETKYDNDWESVIEDFEDEMTALCYRPKQSFKKVEDIDYDKDGIYVDEEDTSLYVVILQGKELVSYC